MGEKCIKCLYMNKCGRTARLAQSERLGRVDEDLCDIVSAHKQTEYELAVMAGGV